MNKVMFQALKSQETTLIKQVDEMYKYNDGEDYSRLTDEEVDLFQEHFDSLIESLDKLKARIEFYETFYK